MAIDISSREREGVICDARMMAPGLALVVMHSAAALSGVVAAPARASAARATLAVALAGVALGVTWLVDPRLTFLRCWLALVGFGACAATLDVVVDRPNAGGTRGWPTAARVLRAATF